MIFSQLIQVFFTENWHFKLWLSHLLLILLIHLLIFIINLGHQLLLRWLFLGTLLLFFALSVASIASKRLKTVCARSTWPKHLKLFRLHLIRLQLILRFYCWLFLVSWRLSLSSSWPTLVLSLFSMHLRLSDYQLLEKIRINIFNVYLFLLNEIC